MTKRSTRLESLNGGYHHFEGDDDDTISTRRSRKRVSYNEDSEQDFDNEEVIPEPEEQPEVKPESPSPSEEDFPPSSDNDDKDDPSEADYVEDGDDDEDFISSSRKRKKKNNKSSRRRVQLNSEDEDFEDDEVSDPDDEFLEELEEKKFIATDDDENDVEDYGYGARKRQKKARSRSRSIEPRGRLTRSQGSAEIPDKPENFEEEEDEAEDSIRKEIEDLYDSSPDPSPVKHKLRERGKIDYTIPPPITNDAQLESMTRSPGISSFSSRGRPRKNANKSEYRKILFPTAGPFGGSDVLSLFGTNIPPGGIPIPGMTNDANLTAIGQNVSDSDSSEDEIAPINGEATVSKKNNALTNPLKPSGPSNNLLITGGASTDKDKKKNNLSDTDPLGVDMNIDFSVVGGLDNYINQLKEMVALPLLYPELYQNFSITPPRGVLFHGPPGTGKTLMARALAASCSTSSRKITFFMRKGADCLSKWVGEAERQLRLLFEEAKNQQPSIIFFDEIDGLAPVRSSKQEQIFSSIVSTLLALMDGMDNRGQVIVIGATNRPDSVDPALRRPGRFDREFYFPLPDLGARKEILQIHTRKWSPPLPSVFLEKVAGLTKGYGGADLRALCTEAALNSIQRKYPQIYQTNEKLAVDPTKVKVVAKDFMKAIEKIIPSSARSTSSASAPLPNHLRPLLEPTLQEIKDKLSDLLPSVGDRKKLTALDEAMYLDPTIKDEDGGFSKQELLKNLENSRICKPSLLIGGDQGYGQQYLSAAILNFLEGFQVQSLDLGNVFGDSTRTPESAIIQTFIEAKRHQPSIIFIPNIDIWFTVMPLSAKATLSGLLRNVKSSEKVLLLGVSETNMDNLDPEIKLLFGFNNEANNIVLTTPSLSARKEFFSNLEKTIKMKPYEFVNDFENRPKRKLKKLAIVQPEAIADKALDKKQIKEQEYKDTKLKNVLKIKLAGLMDLFKNRYKRFKKPIIDENFLYHLFEPSVLENPTVAYEVFYIKSDDPEKPNMIKELSSGKYYHNMDLDIIEERLWNGFYSEAKQFLKDIKLIVKDSITSGDRERILKANEMLTNAQFAIDDFNTPEFAKACRELREREIKKQEAILEEHKKLKEEFEKRQANNLNELDLVPAENGEAKEIDGNGQLDEVKAEKEGKEQEGVNGETGESATAMDVVVESTKQNGHKMDLSHLNHPDPDPSVPVSVPEPLTESVPVPTVESVSAPEPTAESESEAEEELNHDLNRELIVTNDLDSFFLDVLPEMTQNYSIEKLEIVMAKFMDIIWADRSKWDKTETIQKLHSVAEILKVTL